MNRDFLIAAFDRFSVLFKQLGEHADFSDDSFGYTQQQYVDLQSLINKQVHLNGWFTPAMVERSLAAWGNLLHRDLLRSWLASYPLATHPKRVGIIMAGNIPLVGFHDLLCVVMSGHHAVIKMSSDDKTLLPALLAVLFEQSPELKTRITICPFKLEPVDAIIATGSSNSARYFEQYFGHLPNIFRKNRTSVALLDGSESDTQLAHLGDDFFCYFGLGCRNVSHVLIPADFDVNRIFEAVFPFHEVVNHHKYANNYDYNRTIFLMNKIPFLDNGFVLLRESEELFSPLACVHYHRYTTPEDADAYLKRHQDDIQVIVGNGFVAFGEAQQPGLGDYADGVDTMKWLIDL